MRISRQRNEKSRIVADAFQCGRERQSVAESIHSGFPVTKKRAQAFDENRIVRMLQEEFAPARGASIIKGIGDDAAVIRIRGSGPCLVVTTDMLLEDIDFRRDWLTPGQLGHKSLAANLSDLAAMGAKPRFFTAALALPSDITPAWIQAFYRGMSSLAARHDARLIGGDLSRSPSGIQVTIAAIGEAPARQITYRAGGRPGDLLYVTGVLGKAAAGLALLRQGHLRVMNKAERAALDAQRIPEPRCQAGLWLAEHNFAECMMDLSDGLSMDLPRLCEASGVGAEICGSRIPTFDAARAWNCRPEKIALHGGEDFELLFAVSPQKKALLEATYPAGLPQISLIGRLRREPGVFWTKRPGERMRPMIARGFDHFRQIGDATHLLK